MTLARLIAKKVMGWTLEPITPEDACYWTASGTRIYEDAWNPDTDMTDAWLVAERFESVELRKGGSETLCIIDDRFEARHPSAPTAICLAACKALGIELPEEYR